MRVRIPSPGHQIAVGAFFEAAPTIVGCPAETFFTIAHHGRDAPIHDQLGRRRRLGGIGHNITGADHVIRGDPQPIRFGAHRLGGPQV